MKLKTKSIIILMIVFFAMLMLGTTKVSAAGENDIVTFKDNNLKQAIILERL